MSGDERILIVVPCFNEAGSIASVMQEIRRELPDCTILPIDDGSRDATYAIASQFTNTVQLPVNLGIGGAVQTGIRQAERGGYDFCVQIDGDGQHPPAAIHGLLAAYRQRPSNLTIGSRYLHRDGFRSTWTRRLGSAAISATLRLFFPGNRVTDPTSGLRLLDRQAIALFARQYPTDFPEPISIAQAFRAGLTVQEVPATMRSRESGASSIAGLKTLAYMVRVIAYILVYRLQRKEAS